MLVFLTDDVYDEWLAPVRLDTDEKKEHMVGLLHVAPNGLASTNTTDEVDPKVNGPRVADPSDPTLLERI